MGIKRKKMKILNFIVISYVLNCYFGFADVVD